MGQALHPLEESSAPAEAGSQLFVGDALPPPPEHAPLQGPEDVTSGGHGVARVQGGEGPYPPYPLGAAVEAPADLRVVEAGLEQTEHPTLERAKVR